MRQGPRQASILEERKTSGICKANEEKSYCDRQTSPCEIRHERLATYSLRGYASNRFKKQKRFDFSKPISF
ncbi:MAG TPA: hypothetical protein DCZ41_05660 [Firmicutes bacterium]|nr:hypothetical protein [Bacillota bacterium]